MTVAEWSLLGAFQKFGAQVIATLFMPLSLSSINYLFVAIDSLLLITAVSLTVFATKGMPARGLKILAILGSFFFVVIFLAPFVVNFGNGFRLRLMVWAVVAGVAFALINITELAVRSQNRAEKFA